MRPGHLLIVLIFVFTALGGCIADDVDPTGDEDALFEPDPGPLWDQTREWPDNTGVGSEGPIGLQPHEVTFGGSIRHSTTRVLLVPPAHGDPTGGPTTEEYLEVTLLGIREWLTAIDRFVADHPEYEYLQEIDIQIDLFDGKTLQPYGYDIVVAYVEAAGPGFRGAAIGIPVDVQSELDALGVGDMIHWGNRYMVMSLHSSAPRAGQEVPDYPELNDLESVTMHEFAHVWGLGHTRTWTEYYGPDLMNSPYAFIFGDGDPAGDGGIRTPLTCINTLNLYTLAQLYRWLPDGEWVGTEGIVELPEDMEYKLYCRDDTYNQENLDPDAAL